MQILYPYGLEQLERTAKHLLTQAGVDREHGMIQLGIVALDVAEDGKEKFLHLVGSNPDTVYVGRVGTHGEIPIIAIAGMKECRAVAKFEHSAYPHIC